MKTGVCYSASPEGTKQPVARHGSAGGVEKNRSPAGTVQSSSIRTQIPWTSLFSGDPLVIRDVDNTQGLQTANAAGTMSPVRALFRAERDVNRMADQDCAVPPGL